MKDSSSHGVEHLWMVIQKSGTRWPGRSEPGRVMRQSQKSSHEHYTVKICLCFDLILSVLVLPSCSEDIFNFFFMLLNQLGILQRL